MKSSWVYLLYIMSYLAAMLLSKAGADMVSGFLLLSMAFILYIVFAYREKNLVSFPALLSFFWIGGEGLACFKFSKLHTEWSNITWLVFFLFYISFMLGYNLFECDSRRNIRRKKNQKRYRVELRIFICIVLLTILSITALSTEIVQSENLPFFSGITNSYSTISLTGIHYFTISCVLILPLSIIYLFCIKKMTTRKVLTVIFLDLVALSIPILSVSNYLIVIGLIMTFIVLLSIKKVLKVRTVIYLIAIAIVAMIPIRSGMAVFVSKDTEQAEDFYQLEDIDMPLYLVKPYVNIVNNYDNFNCMVEDLPEHAMGVRVLYPILSAAGYIQTKDCPTYTTNDKLDTLPIIYDAYYDFGIVGVVIFGLIFGLVCRKIWTLVREERNPVIYLFYGQIAMYVSLSFYGTWFSSPAIWFWLLLTLCIYFIVELGIEQKKKTMESYDFFKP